MRSVAGLTARIEALGAYEALRRRVETYERVVGSAASTVALAQAGVAAAEATVVATGAEVRHTSGELAQLAVAAYTGSAYAAGGSPQTGGQQADDADAMISVIFGDAEQDVAASEVGAARARAADRTATTGLAATQRAVAADGRLLAHTEGRMQAALAAARSTVPPAHVTAAGPTILGAAVVTPGELAGWYAATEERTATTVKMSNLAADYIARGRATGVRADIAFAQSVVETGYFSFPEGGQLVGRDNNFAGIGACDSCAHGWSFPTATIGVGTQLELLEVYATTHTVSTPLLHGRVGIGGCCTTWTALSGHWATNPSYGTEILSVYDGILKWVLPRRMAADGLG